MNSEKIDMRLRSPHSLLLAGPTMAGKTQFIAKLIKQKEKVFQTPPTHVRYYYQEWNQGLFDELERLHGVQFFNRLPDLQEIKNACIENPKTYFVIDDWAQELNAEMASLFKVQTHHIVQCGVAFMTQNLFSQNKHFRDITLNATYLALFKMPRDKRQLKTFASQFMPDNTHFVMDSYLEATAQPYNPLIVDLHQKTPEHMRLFDRYLHDNLHIRVFQPSKSLYLRN